MGKKHKTKPVVDADGYVRTEIFKRYVGKSAPFTAEDARKWAEKINQPVEEGIASHESWLADCLQHHGVEGLIDSSHIPKLAADADEQAHDAVKALSVIQTLRAHLGPNGNRDRLVCEAFQLGRLVERISVRPFEEYVATGKKHRQASVRGGKASKKLTAEQEKLAKEIIAKERRPGVTIMPACRRASARLKAEHGITVGAKTLSNLPE